MAPDAGRDRRPIASRNRQSSQAMAHALVRRGIAPNTISIAGMLCCLGAALCLGATHLGGVWARGAWLAAALIIQLRLLANMLDGMVAIEAGQTSPVGELYNDIPDRISDTAVLVGLGYAVGGHVALGYSAALLAMLTAYIRAVGKVAGAHQEFCGPMAKPHRMFLVTLLALWSGLAPAAWQPAGGVTSILVLVVLGSALTCVRRVQKIVARLREPRA